MNVKDLNEIRAQREGKVTAKSLSSNLQDNIDDVEALVYVTRGKDGIIRVGWSDIQNTEAIGLLHVAQWEIGNDMWEQG